MKIQELNKSQVNNFVKVTAKINNVNIKKAKTGKEFLIVTLLDDTGKIQCILWDNIYEHELALVVGSTVEINGKLELHGENLRINKVKYSVINNTDSVNSLIPKYNIPIELIRYFEGVVNGLEDKYRKIAVACTGAFGYNNQRWESFTQSPSAETRYGNKVGGLFLHTLGVMKMAEALIRNYIEYPFNQNYNASDVINKDRLILKAIIHDIGKTKAFDYKDCIRAKKTRLSHIEKGATFITEVNIELGRLLSEDELEDIQYSILSQYGEYGKYKLITIEDKIIHNCDMLDSQVATEANKGA